MNLAVSLGKLNLKNPVILASGTCGYGREISPYLDLNQVGAITVKGLSYYPFSGNPPPRLREVYAGVLNSIGLENKGVYDFIQEDLPFLSSFDTRLLVNIWGETANEFVRVAQELDRFERVDALELNVSCPNMERGGAVFCSDLEILKSIVGGVRDATRKPLIVKLGPEVKEWEKTLDILENEGADILSLTNSFPALFVDVGEMDFFFKRKFAGLSGPAIKPLALKMVYEVVNYSSLPVIGMGGIVSADDALEFLLVGAKAVALGVANFVNPASALSILEGIEQYLESKGMESLEDLIGRVK
ncbi:MAG TPA: dihydroorotate dehydrogenase [Candidatus Atribacteria bacterium]|nr:dihydroorotate dehydrogenase [Candidatus Atribacteria bacterium]